LLVLAKAKLMLFITFSATGWVPRLLAGL